MGFPRDLLALAALFVTAWCASVAAEDKAPRAAKLDLTPETFSQVRALVRPQGNEWRHLKIHWFTDIVAARKKAAQEDKPMLFYRTGGAGYNSPLGAC